MKKKILYIGNKLSKKGFTTTYIEILGPLLEKEGCELVYASEAKNQYIRMLDMICITLFSLHKVEIVIIDTYSTFSFYYSLLISQICRLFKKKYICILHGGKLPKRLQNSPFLSQIIFSNAFQLVAPSQYLYSAFEAKFKSNLIYIPNTIEISHYPKFDKAFQTPKLFWLRSFSSIYNPKMAINVLNYLKSDFNDAQLIMVGPNADGSQDECELLAKQLNLNVVFTGKLSKQEWIEYSKNSNFFINTTHFDNTPISVLEAMALGLPIVSTNVGGIPYLLQNNHNAILVDDNDAKAMSDAIKNLLHDTVLREKILNNATILVEQFDWKAVRLKWFDILK